MKNINYIIKNEKGFTMIELLLAIAIFSMLSITIGTLLNYSIKSNKILTEKTARLDNARLTMDFIQTQIKSAEAYKIVSSKELSLKNGKDIITFKFDSIKSEIKFTNNVLSEHVKNFNIELNNDIINIKIEMESENDYNLLEIIGEISVKYKTKY